MTTSLDNTLVCWLYCKALNQNLPLSYHLTFFLTWRHLKEIIFPFFVKKETVSIQFQRFNSNMIQQYLIIVKKPHWEIMFSCGTLHDLVPFVQFKKREKHPWRSVTFSKVAGWSFSFFFHISWFAENSNELRGAF